MHRNILFPEEITKKFSGMDKPSPQNPLCQTSIWHYSYEYNPVARILSMPVVSNTFMWNDAPFLCDSSAFYVFFGEETTSRVTDTTDRQSRRWEASRSTFEIASSSSRVKWISTRLYRTRRVKPSNKRAARRRSRCHGGSDWVWQAPVVPFTCPAGRVWPPRRSRVDGTFVEN